MKSLSKENITSRTGNILFCFGIKSHMLPWLRDIMVFRTVEIGILEMVDVTEKVLETASSVGVNGRWQTR